MLTGVFGGNLDKEMPFSRTFSINTTGASLAYAILYFLKKKSLKILSMVKWTTVFLVEMVLGLIYSSVKYI